MGPYKRRELDQFLMEELGVGFDRTNQLIREMVMREVLARPRRGHYIIMTSRIDEVLNIYTQARTAY